MFNFLWGEKLTLSYQFVLVGSLMSQKAVVNTTAFCCEKNTNGVDKMEINLYDLEPVAWIIGMSLLVYVGWYLGQFLKQAIQTLKATEQTLTRYDELGEQLQKLTEDCQDLSDGIRHEWQQLQTLQREVQQLLQEAVARGLSSWIKKSASQSDKKE